MSTAVVVRLSYIPHRVARQDSANKKSGTAIRFCAVKSLDIYGWWLYRASAYQETAGIIRTRRCSRWGGWQFSSKVMFASCGLRFDRDANRDKRYCTSFRQHHREKLLYLFLANHCKKLLNLFLANHREKVLYLSLANQCKNILYLSGQPMQNGTVPLLGQPL